MAPLDGVDIAAGGVVVGASFFWRRLPGGTVAGGSARELEEMVPYWHDREFASLRDAGMVLGVERIGDVMHAVLTFDDREEGACELPVYGGEVREEGEEHPEYGFLGAVVWVLEPPQVREAAWFLRGVDVAQRVREVESVFTDDEDSPLDLLMPWDDDVRRALHEGLVRLATFFVAAAAAGDAVVKRQSA
ncbi:hypothetical protein ACIRL2_26855 [Embleya sp. NPDC127516]|uniref:hypothetical protein n=1 Tax=Embleya sp. NPDC127516 TaxID=3363990 RepID=UPI00382D671F